MYVIYCDLDGVLVDFDKGYEELTGIVNKEFIKGDYNFWKPISDAGASFWANLEWMSDGKVLWNYIKDITKTKPFLLSAPSRDPSSKIGKQAWCKIHLNNQYDTLLLYPRAQKQTFSGPNKILIDDMEVTINEWNKKGGIGILHTSAYNTINELKKIGL